jgi:hypothetical protein
MRHGLVLHPEDQALSQLDVLLLSQLPGRLQLPTTLGQQRLRTSTMKVHQPRRGPEALPRRRRRRHRRSLLEIRPVAIRPISRRHRRETLGRRRSRQKERTGSLTSFAATCWNEQIVESWLAAFTDQLQPHEVAEPLREAASTGSLGEWTQFLTAAVVASCAQLKWPDATGRRPYHRQAQRSYTNCSPHPSQHFARCDSHLGLGPPATVRPAAGATGFSANTT